MIVRMAKMGRFCQAPNAASWNKAAIREHERIRRVADGADVSGTSGTQARNEGIRQFSDGWRYIDKARSAKCQRSRRT